MAPQKINIKERVTDGEIDLSMSDLQDVPVKEIASFKKAQSLDLSNNHLKTLPNNFATLTHLTKLDLSKNQLTELPENFGDLVKLKYLDLYQNQLQYLPLSFSKLKALKWLDLKDNPLVPAVAKVSGQCLDAKQCQTCAKDVVNFFIQVQEQIDSDIESRQKQKQKQLEMNQQKQIENKKNKKKGKAKQKKENGPNKENVVKGSNKKNKKSTITENQAYEPSSLFKSFIIFAIIALLIVFILTSVKYEHTIIVERTVVDLYSRGLNSLPLNLQGYFIQMGSYVKYTHEKTGNITMVLVNYVRNTNIFVNAYNSFIEPMEDMYYNVLTRI